MDERPLGTTGYRVTEVGMGTWNIGGDWGAVSDEEGRDAVRTVRARPSRTGSPQPTSPSLVVRRKNSHRGGTA